MRDRKAFTGMAGEAIAALEALAAEDAPLKERLVDAWTNHLSKLHDMELRPEFQKRFDHMKASLPAQELLADAIDKLTPEEARLLARRMVHFALDIEMTTGAEHK